MVGGSKVEVVVEVEGGVEDEGEGPGPPPPSSSSLSLESLESLESPGWRRTGGGLWSLAPPSPEGPGLGLACLAGSGRR